MADGLVPGLRVVRRESVDPLRDGEVSGLFRSPPLPAGRGGSGAAAARAPLRLALAESDEEPDGGWQGQGRSPPPLVRPTPRGREPAPRPVSGPEAAPVQLNRRSDQGAAIRANFESLVRASPMPKVVRDRLASKSPGGLQALSPSRARPPTFAGAGELRSPAPRFGPVRGEEEAGPAPDAGPSSEEETEDLPPEDGGAAPERDLLFLAQSKPGQNITDIIAERRKPAGKRGAAKPKGKGKGTGKGKQAPPPRGSPAKAPKKGKAAAKKAAPPLKPVPEPVRSLEIRKQAESVDVQIKPARTTRSGRKVFSKLEFWRNQKFVRDESTQEVIGVAQGTSGGKVKVEKPAARKAPASRPAVGRAGKAEVPRKAPTRKVPARKAKGTKRRIADSEEDSDSEDPASEASLDQAGDGDWSKAQIEALQSAQVVLDPTAANYWQLVAKKVPGKTANECYAKMFESHPTPQEKNVRARRYLGSSDEDGAPAGPKVKKATKGAVKKRMRSERWQKRQAIAGIESTSDSSDIEDDDNFFQTVENQARADQYMDKFKRQQVKFSKATKGKKPAKTVDMVLDDGRSDSLAAAIRNAIANATPNKESDDEDEDEESSDEL